MSRRSVLIAVVGLTVAPVAAAGVTKLTDPVSKGEKVVYIFTGGTIDNTAPDDTAVVVSCMNISMVDPVTVRIELFGDIGGALLGKASLVLAPGETEHVGSGIVNVLNAVTLTSPNPARADGVGGRVVLVGRGTVLCTARLYVNHTTSTPSVASLDILPVPKAPKFKPKKK
jgi:hypothetical protein